MNQLLSPVCISICALISLVAGSLHARSTELSFDTLFPETAEKQLYDTVLQLWSDVTLFHDQDLDDVHKQQLVDLVAGQLVRIDYLLEYMHTKGDGLHPEDMIYLRGIIIALHENYHKTFFSQQHLRKAWDGVCERFVVCQSF